MFYDRKFLVNGKPVEKLVSGDLVKADSSKKFTFEDVETGYKFNSFYEMYNYFNYDDFASTKSYGTSAYHCDFGTTFVWTDGVSEIIERNEAYWILSLIASYYPFVSETLAMAEDGRINFVNNPLVKVGDANDFLLISILKLSDNSAFFSIDVENWKDDDSEYKTLACQFIPNTDLKDDYVYFFGESGLIMHPQEH